MGYKTICKVCKKHKFVTPRGFCLECATDKVKISLQEMKDHKGLAWDRWKLGYRKYINKQAKQERVKICPKCCAEQKLSAKKCTICEFYFKDYSKRANQR